MIKILTPIEILTLIEMNHDCLPRRVKFVVPHSARRNIRNGMRREPDRYCGAERKRLHARTLESACGRNVWERNAQWVLRTADV